MTRTVRAILGVFLLAAAVVAAAMVMGRDRDGHVPGFGRWFSSEHVEGDVWVCPMHPEVRQAGPGTCPKCKMDLVRETPVPVDQGDRSAAPGFSSGAGQDDGSIAPLRAPLTLDLRRQQLIGVRLVPVTRAPLTRSIRATGIVRYDETRLSDVNVKLEGWIEQLYVDTTGAPITKGQPLFTLYSPDLLATQNEYLLALKMRDQLDASTIADTRAYADRLASAARQRLELWDLPPDEIAALEKERQPRTTMVFRSPVTGYVIEKRALKGLRVMAGESLYRVADLSVVWVEADVYESELAFARPGAQVSVTVDAYPGETFNGRIGYIYPLVAEQTRTVRVRIELGNRRARLKPGMFATVTIDSSLGTGLTVPTDAVIDSGRASFVFVSQGDGHFEPRQIETGARLEGKVQVVSGLEEGQQVAGGATFFIDSESQLAAAMQGYVEPPPLAAAATGRATSTVQLTFRSTPDPPRNGDNTFEVTVADAAGTPITDAEVSVRLYMAPMPSMNMPAMRSDVRLLHEGAGRYRGQGNVSMAGRWDVTVTATRGGERLGTQQLAIVAK